LEAIEKDQWELLPGGVFNRGFIRSIARFLGLDEDSLVAEYALGMASDAHVHVAAQRSHHMPRNWRPAAAAVVAIALVIAGGIFGFRRYGSGIAARLHERFLVGRAGARTGVATSQAAAPGPGAANESPAPVAVPPVSDQASATLTLKMQAAKQADVKVIADGKIVFDGTVQPGDVKQFNAQDNFEITSSESSAVSLELNGQGVALTGTQGQAGSVALTRNNLKPVTGGSH
jgi:cytoskeleton protein RodZ